MTAPTITRPALASHVSTLRVDAATALDAVLHLKARAADLRAEGRGAIADVIEAELERFVTVDQILDGMAPQDAQSILDQLALDSCGIWEGTRECLHAADPRDDAGRCVWHAADGAPRWEER